ncbi:MAG: hypothetical protein ABFS34_13115 [Gemmatimonadota bacterium]
MSGVAGGEARGVQLEPAYFELARELRDDLTGRGLFEGERRPVVGIGGESGSGKTITALCLALELARTDVPCTVLHQDDYFRLPPRQNHEARRLDLDVVGPGEVDFDRLNEHVAAFREGRPVEDAPLVDYPRDLFHSRPLDLGAARVLLVEGTYVLAHVDVDLRVFMEGHYPDTHSRRRERNRDPDDPLIERVLAIEHEIIRAHAGAADITIGIDFRIAP